MTTSDVTETCPKGFLETKVPLTATQRQLSTRLESWNLDFVLERMIWEGKFSEDEGRAGSIEFKRFMLLIGMGYAPIAMISPKIDELWHQMVLFTRRYQAFCLDTFGFFVHHTPETPEHPIPAEAAARFLMAYEENFGRLPAIWFAGMTKELKRYYDARPFVDKPPVRWSGWTGEDQRKGMTPRKF